MKEKGHQATPCRPITGAPYRKADASSTLKNNIVMLSILLWARIDSFNHSSQKVTIKATRKFANRLSGFQEFDQWITKHKDPSLPIVYVMEATGVYYEQLAWYLFEREQHVSVILPNKASKSTQSLGLKSKNDKIDSIGLAHMGAQQAK